jgi:hypothetical protein
LVDQGSEFSKLVPLRLIRPHIFVLAGKAQKFYSQMAVKVSQGNHKLSGQPQPVALTPQNHGSPKVKAD